MIQHILSKTAAILFQKQGLAAGVVLLGSLIRLHDLGGRSFWRDEAWVANLASSDKFFDAFFTKMPIPPLFIATLYSSVHLFINNEWFLRIVPALFGIGGMILFYYMLREWFGTLEAVSGLMLFSFLPVLIVYSRELKQYSGDLFFTILVIILSEQILRNKGKAAPWYLLAISGGIGLWFSYPLVFVLGALGIVLLWHILWSVQRTSLSALQKYRPLFHWLITFTLILTSFILLYILVIRHQTSEEGLESFWRGAFPDTSGIVPFLKWLGESTWNLFVYFWNGYTPVVFLFSIAGIWELMRSGRSRILLYWCLIFSFVLMASFFHRYPFGGHRVMYFTAPFFIILLVCGIKAVWVLSKTSKIWRLVTFVGLFLITMQVVDATLYLQRQKGYLWYVQYPKIQDIRSALLVVEQARQPQEPIYVYYGADLAFKYYSMNTYKRSFSPVLIGKIHRDRYSDYIHELEPILQEKKPFWFLATHYLPPELDYIHKKLVMDWHYQGQLYFRRDGAVLIYYHPKEKI